MRHQFAPALLAAIALLLLGTAPAAGFFVDHEYYAYANYSDGIPFMEDLMIQNGTFTQGDFTKTGSYGNYGTAFYWGYLGAATVQAECHAHGVEYEPNRIATGTGRVETIRMMDDLHFSVPAGYYPAGVTVGVTGFARGEITSSVGAGSEAGLWISLGTDVYQTGVLIVGIAESGTILVDDAVVLTQELVAPGATLATTTVYTRQVQILLHRGWTWAVSYNTVDGYVTGDGHLDFRNGDRGLGITSVDVPPGVTWTSDSGVFLNAVSAAPSVATPDAPVLHQNHPNPFNPATTISFELAAPGPVDVEIYDVSGRLVRRLLRSEPRPAGPGRVVWRGRDESGAAVATGVYLCRLRSGQEVRTRRMLLLR